MTYLLEEASHDELVSRNLKLYQELVGVRYFLANKNLLVKLST